MAKKSTAGGEAAPSGSLFLTPVSKEEMEAAEAEFPYLRMDGPTGEWVARMLSKGVKKADILTAMDRGRVPGFQEDE